MRIHFTWSSPLTKELSYGCAVIVSSSSLALEAPRWSRMISQDGVSAFCKLVTPLVVLHLQVNRSKTELYSPNGNYVGKPQRSKVRSVTAILPNHLNGEPTEIKQRD